MGRKQRTEPSEGQQLSDVDRAIEYRSRGSATELRNHCEQLADGSSKASAPSRSVASANSVARAGLRYAAVFTSWGLLPCDLDSRRVDSQIGDSPSNLLEQDTDDSDNHSCAERESRVRSKKLHDQVISSTPPQVETAHRRCPQHRPGPMNRRLDQKPACRAHLPFGNAACQCGSAAARQRVLMALSAEESIELRIRLFSGNSARLSDYERDRASRLYGRRPRR